MKDTLFSSILKFNTKGILREFRKPIVMGILNATPDSFHSESRVQGIDLALDKARKMNLEGATILDIGGYSSRPGALAISEEEELNRVLPLIVEIRNEFPELLISIDTFRSKVAHAAVLAGADIINDISGGQLDPKIFAVAADFQCPYILMHMIGTPQNMMDHLDYAALLPELLHFFSRQTKKAKTAGVKDIILDPGFGFSKNSTQNFELLNRLDRIKLLEYPILVGVSRKSMIHKTLGISASESLNGTSILNTIALERGAAILRVHDVKEAVEAVKLIELTRLSSC